MSDQTPQVNRTPHRDRAEKAEAEVATLTARCEALQQSNDEKHRHIALVEAREQEQVVALRVRCEALQQQVQEERAISEGCEQARFATEARCEALEQEQTGLKQFIHDLTKGCTCGSGREASARYGHPHLAWCDVRSTRPDTDRLQRQAIDISVTLSDAGVNSMPIPEGVRSLVQRCEALIAERDTELERAPHYREQWQTVQSRCQHLEQAIRGLLGAWPEAARQINNAITLHTVRTGRQTYTGPNVQAHIDALASLLPTQEETPGTDENRVSFAAGYTAALDDALKGTP